MFIRLTDKDDHPILINTDLVISIEPDGDDPFDPCTIYFNHGTYREVQETLSEIRQKIKILNA